MKVVVSTDIHKPPQVVFPVAADPEQQLKWDPKMLLSVEKLTQGPLGKGARYRGKFKGMGTVEYEFVEFEAPKLFAPRAKMPMGEMRHIWTFEAVAEGTKLSQEGQLRPNLLGWLLSPLIRRMLRRRFRQIGERLQEYFKAH